MKRPALCRATGNPRTLSQVSASVVVNLRWWPNQTLQDNGTARISLSECSTWVCAERIHYHRKLSPPWIQASFRKFLMGSWHLPATFEVPQFTEPNTDFTPKLRSNRGRGGRSKMDPFSGERPRFESDPWLYCFLAVWSATITFTFCVVSLSLHRLSDSYVRELFCKLN